MWSGLRFFAQAFGLRYSPSLFRPFGYQIPILFSLVFSLRRRGRSVQIGSKPQLTHNSRKRLSVTNRTLWSVGDWLLLSLSQQFPLTTLFDYPLWLLSIVNLKIFQSTSPPQTAFFAVSCSSAVSVFFTVICEVRRRFPCLQCLQRNGFVIKSSSLSRILSNFVSVLCNLSRHVFVSATTTHSFIKQVNNRQMRWSVCSIA